MNVNAARESLGHFFINTKPYTGVAKEAVMKAIQFSGPASINQLRTIDIPVPAPAKGEIRIKTEAYAFIPGTDDFAGIAGTIDNVGSGVSGFARGAKIFGVTEGGVCAQYTVLKAEQAAPIPANLEFAQAAALAAPIITAHIVLTDVGRLRWGQRLLIRNATTDVAKYVLQIAKATGIHVTATASREHMATLQNLRVDRCLDDSDGDFLENLADMVLQFALTGALTEIRFPKHRISLPAAAAITWQKDSQRRLLVGKDLVMQGTLKPLPLQQSSWKNPANLQASLRKVQTGQLILIAD